jgi:hypothetical protein
MSPMDTAIAIRSPTMHSHSGTSRHAVLSLDTTQATPSREQNASRNPFAGNDGGEGV